MSEKFLHREDTPFSDKVWQIIDRAVVSAAKSQLCGTQASSHTRAVRPGIKSSWKFG